MSVSQIKICNLALIRVGADRISSISEDTKSAIVLNAIYELLRDSVLRAHPWNCATKRAILSPTATTPDFEFDYEYDLPSDCLRPSHFWTGSARDDVDFTIEGRKILTNETSLDMEYIFNNTDESSWDSNLADALAWRLASEIAYSLTQSIALAQACAATYKAILAEARSMDGVEGRPLKLFADEWTKARK